jgi:hypothetical protein
MRSRRLHWSALIALTAFFTVALGAVAIADDVGNDLDASVDAVAEVMSLNVGGASGTTQLYIVPRNGDGKNGCNLTGSTTLVVSVSSNNTGIATVSPSSVTFASCGNTATLTVTPHDQGSATVSVLQTSNNTGGTFNLDSATFTVSVAPPPNAAPTISVTDVTGGASYEFGSIPAGGCSVVDAEDGNSTFAASLSAISGPLAAYGLGSQTANCSYTDAGGLTASASVTYGIVDTTKPTLNLPATITEEATSAGGAIATFSVSATDAVDPSPDVVCSPDSGALFPIGTTTVNCTATDVAGNVRNGSFDVTVQDTTDPVVTISTSALLGVKGWYNIESSGTGGIIATVTASDAVGVASVSCQNSGTTIDGVSASGDTFTLGDGDHNVTCTAMDGAGNDRSDAKEFKVDQTLPAITPSYSVAGNGAGWNNTDVTVSYTCSDETSDIDPVHGCPADDVLTANGLYVLHKSTGDNAGNTATPEFTVKIDKDAPTISGTASPTANSDGWNNTDVTVHFICTEVGPSGLKSCTPDSTLTEGANLSVTGTAVDNADNSASVAVGPINIDKTDPVITVASRTPANAQGWNNGPVTVTFACDDGNEADDSGVVFLTDPQSVSTDGIHSVTGTCTDEAGNNASVTVSDIKIDTQKPTITGSRSPEGNSRGWNNTDVVVSFVCSDNAGGSGTKTDTVDGATLTSEGSDQSVTNSGSCIDKAGNAADPATVGGINIDKSAPTAIAFVGGGLADNGTYYFNFVPAGPSSCTANGAISGLDLCTLDLGYSTAVGTHSITATALDRAGNQSAATLTYNVSAWTATGFYQPVDMPTPTTPLLYNTVKNGSTVPLKFELFAGGTELSSTSYVKPLMYAEMKCDATASMDEIETTATGGTALRYDAAAGQFVYNWQTPKTANKCYRVTMYAIDGAGASLVAYFRLK